MTPEHQLKIRAELARRMGISESEWLSRCRVEGHRIDDDGFSEYCYNCGEAVHLLVQVPPNPFTNAEDNRALVAWICSDKSPATFDDEAFLSGISKIYGQLKTPHSKRELACAMWDTFTAPLETITLSAARALGILEAGE